MKDAAVTFALPAPRWSPFAHCAAGSDKRFKVPHFMGDVPLNANGTGLGQLVSAISWLSEAPSELPQCRGP